MEKPRTEAFSDGVFAIAITLLILEIAVPEHGVDSNRDLARALVALWPSFLAFVTSFATILVVWINHHGLFHLVQRTNRWFLLANGLLLMMVTVIPFPTALLAAHLTTGGAETAAVVYCSTFVLLNIAFHLVLLAATSSRLLHDDVSPAQIRRLRRAYAAAFVVYVAAAIVSAFHGLVGTLICSVLWILWARLSYARGAAKAPHMTT